MSFFKAMLAKRGNAIKEGAARIENKDFMEAIVGGCVMVAFVDGSCSDDELAKLEGLIQNNPRLKHFGGEINAQINKFVNLMKAGARTGKVQIMRELADVKGDHQQKEDVFLALVEIADSDGNIDDKEKALLKQVAQSFGLNPKDYDLDLAA